MYLSASIFLTIRNNTKFGFTWDSIVLYDGKMENVISGTYMMGF